VPPPSRTPPGTPVGESQLWLPRVEQGAPSGP
jgi:hypothetical protein